MSFVHLLPSFCVLDFASPSLTRGWTQSRESFRLPSRKPIPSRSIRAGFLPIQSNTDTSSDCRPTVGRNHRENRFDPDKASERLPKPTVTTTQHGPSILACHIPRLDPRTTGNKLRRCKPINGQEEVCASEQNRQRSIGRNRLRLQDPIRQT